MRTWPALRLSGLTAPLADVGSSATDLLHAALSDHSVAAIEELSDDEWQVFFGSSDERHAAAGTVSSLFPSLHVIPTEIDDEDWAARSQASLHAIRADGIVIAPPWDTDSAPDLLQIVIQPSMGFGTGHHATTRLCLKALQQLDLHGRDVADIGTGSGVLAIAAGLLGAAEVVGIDDDADAVGAAVDNLELNDVTAVRFAIDDLKAFDQGPFDVVTANLTGGLLATTAPRLQELVRPGGRLILSGIMVVEADHVLSCFDSCRLLSRTDEDDWVCVMLERRDR